MGDPQDATGRCSLTAQQLEAFELFARGLTVGQTARAMGIASSNVSQLHRAGAAKLGVETVEEAVQILVDGGWVLEMRLPPAALAYVRAFHAYLLAPADLRDQLLVRELCDEALAELLDGTA